MRTHDGTTASTAPGSQGIHEPIHGTHAPGASTIPSPSKGGVGLAGPTDAALDLVRTALIVKLAVDLDDAPLARRAAREAGSHARRLAARVLPTDAEVEVHAAVLEPGLSLAELLRRAYPQASLLDVEDDAAVLDDDQPDDDDSERMPSRAAVYTDDYDGGAAA